MFSTSSGMGTFATTTYKRPDFLQEEPAVQLGHGLVVLPPVLLFTEVPHHCHQRSTFKRRTCRQVHTCSGPCYPRGACTNIELSVYFSCDNTSLYTQYPLILLCVLCGTYIVTSIVVVICVSLTHAHLWRLAAEHRSITWILATYHLTVSHTNFR